MIISKLLKVVGILAGVVALLVGFSYGDQLSLGGNFNFDVALAIWASGFVMALVLYGFGELINQQRLTNQILAQWDHQSKKSEFLDAEEDFPEEDYHLPLARQNKIPAESLKLKNKMPR